jgi:hypothetical protein
VAVVKKEAVPAALPGFKKKYGTASGKKGVPASSVAVKKKRTHRASSVAAPSSSLAVRSAAKKLAAARREAKKKLVAPEVDTSSDTEPLVGKCSHCIEGGKKTARRRAFFGFAPASNVAKSAVQAPTPAR